MEVIGFIALIIIGAYFGTASFAVPFITLSFGGQLQRREIIASVVMISISASCLYFAFKNSPFTISWSVK